MNWLFEKGGVVAIICASETKEKMDDGLLLLACCEVFSKEEGARVEEQRIKEKRDELVWWDLLIKEGYIEFSTLFRKVRFLNRSFCYFATAALPAAAMRALPPETTGWGDGGDWMAYAKLACQWEAPLSFRLDSRIRLLIMRKLRHYTHESVFSLLVDVGAFASKANRACLVENVEKYLLDLDVTKQHLGDGDRPMLLAARNVAALHVCVYMALGRIGFDWDDYMSALDSPPPDEAQPSSDDTHKEEDRAIAAARNRCSTTGKEIIMIVVVLGLEVRELLKLRLVGNKGLCAMATAAIPRAARRQMPSFTEAYYVVGWMQYARMALQWEAPLSRALEHHVRAAVLLPADAAAPQQLVRALVSLGAYRSREARVCLVSTVSMFLRDLKADAGLCERYDLRREVEQPRREVMEEAKMLAMYSHGYNFEEQAWGLE